MEGFDEEQQELIKSLLKKRDELLQMQETIQRLQAMEVAAPAGSAAVEPAPEPEPAPEADEEEEEEEQDDQVTVGAPHLQLRRLPRSPRLA